ncbi:MAG: TolC family protein [Candidatus Electrothrix sp. AR4]|nr:TolC family protein [Candidatus Electrothrix sp. AR4]
MTCFKQIVDYPRFNTIQQRVKLTQKVELISSNDISGAEKVDGDFKIDSINKIINYTFKVNPKLNTSENITKAAEYEVRQAKGGYFPTLEFNSYAGAESLSNSWNRSNGTDDFDQMNSVSITLIQNLFSGFATKNNVKKSQLIYEGADSRWTAMELSLAKDTILSYLDIYEKRKLMDLSETNIKEYKEDMNKNFYIKSNTDLDLAQWRSEEAERILNTDIYNYKVSSGKFYYLTGIDLEKKMKDEVILMPDELIKLGNSIIRPSAELQDKAMSNNPDIKAMKSDIKAAKKQKEIIKGRFYPKVDIELSSIYKDQEGHSYTVDQHGWLRLQWHFYNGGSDQAAKNAAMARKQAKISKKKERDLEIKQKISERYMEWEKVGSQIEKLEKEISANNKILQNFQEKYKNKETSLKDFYDTRRDLFMTKRSLVSEQIDKIIAASSIRMLCGDLIGKLNEFAVDKNDKIQTHIDMR